MALMKRLRGFLGALAIIFSFLAFAHPALAQSVEVTGNSRVSAGVIQGYFTGTDQASIDRGVSDLLATGLFTKVSAHLVGGHVVVAVVEGKVIINRVAFEGNSKLKGEQLGVEVQSHERDVYDEKVAAGDVDRLKEAYKKIGRSQVKIAYRTVPLPNGRVDLVFKIDEGDKTGVKSINFVGNQAVSSYRLLGLMETTQMNFLSWLKTTDVYDPDRLATDEDSIRKYYQRNGYADFRITNTDVQYVDSDTPGYNITISVDEGAQYKVSSVNVVSHLPKVDSSVLAPLATLSAGDIYNSVQVDKSVLAITRALATYGYAFSDVRPHGERDTAAHTIALTFTADDGPKVYIERIDVTGNTRTRDFVIRREFDIGEGDPYNHAMIETAERRLNNLGFFKKVHISTRPGSSPDRVIVMVEVEDQPTGSVSLSGGYSTTLGWIAEVAFTETNFLGRGQYLKLSASQGQSSKGYSASFTEPYFFGQHIAAGIDLYHNEQDQNAFQTYQYWVNGVNLRLGFPITEALTFQPNYSIYQSKVVIPNTASQPYNDCVAPGLPWIPGGTTTAVVPTATNNCLINGEASIASKEAASLGNRLTSLVGYSFIYNTIDNPKVPTSGMFLNFHQDIAGLGGQARYLKETFDGKFYYPISDDFTGLVHLQGGQINAFGGRSLLITDNFNLGPTLVRGFAPGGLGPRDISDPNNIAANALGGTSYAGASGEVQFPLFGVPKEIGLRGAFFADAGSLWGYHGQTNFSPLFNLPAGSPCNNTAAAAAFTQGNCLQVQNSHMIRASLGASILWDSPVGPIRLDFAYPLRKAAGDQTQVFNFSGGASF